MTETPGVPPRSSIPVRKMRFRAYSRGAFFLSIRGQDAETYEPTQWQLPPEEPDGNSGNCSVNSRGSSGQLQKIIPIPGESVRKERGK